MVPRTSRVSARTTCLSLAIGTAGWLLAVSCDSPVAPRGVGERVSIGSIVEDAMNGDTVRDYSFAGTPGGVYAVFLEVLQGDVMLLVVDSANGRVAGTTYASAGTGTLYDRATADFQDPAGGPFLISVRASPVGSAARFRFLAFAVDVAPEAAKARFTIGDTVMGEAIDPMVDVDDFTAHVIGCCSTR